MTERTLMVAIYLPPDGTGSSYVMGNLGTQFSRQDMLAVGEAKTPCPPEPWGPSGPRMEVVQFRWPFTRRGIRWWRWLQLPRMIWRCVAAGRRFGCTSVFVQFPDASFLLAGYLTARVTRAKLFPYLHNTYVENRRGLGLRVARWLQKKVFQRASHVFVMSDGMVELYRRNYPDLHNCSALVHSFTEPIPAFEEPPVPGSPVKLVFFGNVNESCRDAAQRIVQAVRQIDDARMTFLTSTSPSYLARVGLLSDRVDCCFVPEAEVPRRLGEADILALPHGFTGGLSAQEYQTIFPTKTIPYLISRRPILAHSPPGCFYTRFLKQTGCALVVEDPDVGALVKAVQSLRSDPDLRRGLVRGALATAERFHISRVFAELRSRMQEAGPAGTSEPARSRL
jgi:glycosyltransferase involved in cell wall biosynthesis